MHVQLGQELVRAGVATRSIIDAALAVAGETHQRLGDVRIESSSVDELRSTLPPERLAPARNES
jgi:hypothetical protein